MRTPLKQPVFLPMSRREMDVLGWDELDILLVSGDAYVDHPSFGVPLLGRFLIDCGYRVGIIAQPPWHGEGVKEAFLVMGRPRLFAGVSAGALDSLLAHSTAFRRKRRDDAYTPDGIAGARPDRAVIVYANLIRRFFPNLPLLAGGIEASLRRVSHYDFWTDSVRRSILFDARLDLLVYGMGESALLAAAERLDDAFDVYGEDALRESSILQQVWSGISGTAYLVSRETLPKQEVLALPSHEEICEKPFCLVEATMLLEQACHQARLPLVQWAGDRAVWHETPAPPLETASLDALYALPFARKPHPSYKKPIPADIMISTSITTHRGCAGGCSFCSLALHQGRRIASRSRDSILQEAQRITKPKACSISDVGGPTANMWQAHCARKPAHCERASCLTPKLCKGFVSKQRACVSLLREIAALPAVRHVRVASGVRFDMLVDDADAMAAYTTEFTGGQLKVAPEHVVSHVLARMRKPTCDVFERFIDDFYSYTKACGKEQYVIPYLISGFPGCTDSDMRELADWLRARNWSPEQVQCFIPTPGTLATAMFYSECDQEGNSLFVARDDASRRRQHALICPPPKDAGARGRLQRGRIQREGSQKEPSQGERTHDEKPSGDFSSKKMQADGQKRNPRSPSSAKQDSHESQTVHEKHGSAKRKPTSRDTSSATQDRSNGKTSSHKKKYFSKD